MRLLSLNDFRRNAEPSQSGVAVDRDGNVFSGFAENNDVKKYVKN